jgi:hypothetical protein
MVLLSTQVQMKMVPFIDYDGKTLYFSSRGHEGMGGYDIFVSEYDSAGKNGQSL